MPASARARGHPSQIDGRQRDCHPLRQPGLHARSPRPHRCRAKLRPPCWQIRRRKNRHRQVRFPRQQALNKSEPPLSNNRVWSTGVDQTQGGSRINAEGRGEGSLPLVTSPRHKLSRRVPCSRLGVGMSSAPDKFSHQPHKVRCLFIRQHVPALRQHLQPRTRNVLCVELPMRQRNQISSSPPKSKALGSAPAANTAAISDRANTDSIPPAPSPPGPVKTLATESRSAPDVAPTSKATAHSDRKSALAQAFSNRR